MDFQNATDRMMELGASLRELATELGVSHQAVMQARMDPSTTSYRKPPEGWRDAILKIARRRQEGFEGLIQELEEENTR